MKEVLYRAKRKDNGEWVEGYYVRLIRRSATYDEFVHYIICSDSVITRYDDFINYYEIIPETLGRLLGHPCWNGDYHEQRFFQDDIIAVWKYGWKHGVNECDPDTTALVIDEHSISEDGFGRWFPQDTTAVRVIGNAHDNPELLKGHDLRMFVSCINDKYPDEYPSQHYYITNTYKIHGAHAGCYLCNFENEYICHQFNGGCDRFNQCQFIKNCEDRKNVQ